MSQQLLASTQFGPTRRRDDRWLAGLHCDGCDDLGHRRGKKRGLRLGQRNPDRVHQICGNRGARVERDV
jgi:hypothetical protein